MSLKCIFTVTTMTLCGLAGTVTGAGFNPGALWKDTNGVAINAHGGGLLYHNGTTYWYGEHKIAGKAGNKAQVGVHCYSSKDLTTWQDEGIALSVSDDPKSDIAKGCILERPKVIYNAKTGTFVMWFHLEFKGQKYTSARSGVAVADSPTGPFTFIRSGRPLAGVWPQNSVAEQRVTPEPNTQKKPPHGGVNIITPQVNVLGRDFPGGQMARDMTLFVDDDGQAYHIYSSEENSTTHIALLTEDYRSHAGPYVRIFPHRWMEAPAICKRHGKYYFLASGCSGWAPNTARYGIAEQIFGPWTEFDNPCRGENQTLGFAADKTFGGQSTYIHKLPGQDAYIAMFDIWNPDNAIDGRYVWLPLTFRKNSQLEIHWHDQWDHSVFAAQKKTTP